MNKICINCKESFKEDQFPFVPSKKRRLARCHACKKAYDREYWARTKDRRNERKRENISNSHRRNVQYVLDYLKNHPCEYCNETDPLVLEFDHKDPTTKVNHVSLFMRSRSLKSLKQEISKCRVLCANCHRRKTAEQFKYTMWRIINGV
jgi:hypothetical protein